MKPNLRNPRKKFNNVYIYVLYMLSKRTLSIKVRKKKRDCTWFNLMFNKVALDLIQSKQKKIEDRYYCLLLLIDRQDETVIDTQDIHNFLNKIKVNVLICTECLKNKIK